MLSPRGQTVLEAEILSSASTSASTSCPRPRPRPQEFGIDQHHWCDYRRKQNYHSVWKTRSVRSCIFNDAVTKKAGLLLISAECNQSGTHRNDRHTRAASNSQSVSGCVVLCVIRTCTAAASWGRRIPVIVGGPN